MNPHIDDIQIWIGKDRLGPRSQSDAAPPILHVIHFMSSGDLPSLGRALRNKYGYGIEGTGFTYPTDLDEDDEEEPFEGVQLHDPFDEMVVTEAQFDALMLKLFDAWIAVSAEHDLDRKPWWPDFLRDVETIRARVATRG
ncbi:MAG: hypothetical protein H6739_36785 [Alphaproteobacteria bacterium]|nr:hypothetical protein [Alphaproteobacteria bacterium]